MLKRYKAFTFLLATALVLWVGCDTTDSLDAPDQPTVQFASSGTGAIPRDTTATVAVEAQNLQDDEISVEVLFAESASSDDVPDQVQGLPENGNTVDLTFSPGQETQELTFDVSEVDISQGQQQARFALQQVSEGAKIAEPREFSLSIGAEPIDEVKERAREQGGGEVTATMQGTITRSRGIETRFQDESGGLFIRQTEGDFFDDVQNGELTVGDEIIVTGTIEFFSGITQINGEENLADYNRFSRDNELPAPFESDLEGLTEDPEPLESRLVRVENVTIVAKDDGDQNEVDPGNTFDAGTTYVIEDGSGGGGSLDLEDNITLRIPGSDNTAVDGTEIPTGEFTFQGVLTQFNAFQSPTEDVGYQLLVVEEEDIITE